MVKLFRLLVIVPLLFLVSCPGQLPSMGVLAPEKLAGYEMDATGMEGSYYYTFAADGSYSRVTTKPSGDKTKPYKGTWKWERTSIRTAKLTLDDQLVVSLHFTTREHANASVPTTQRLYPVEFTAPR